MCLDNDRVDSFDTNVYIEAIQVGPTADSYQLLLSTLPRTYLSAVVVQELYTGTLDAFGARLVGTFVHQVEKTGRTVVPTSRDWKEVGKLLARISRQEPAPRTRLPRLVNDVLLAMSARQIGATLFTFNEADFRLIARYKRFSLKILSCRRS
ncbi:MAG: type II toxin-antitoxin system VapC family toxin [Nitrospinae bacterium]|nr:type II toxin-antitoxin system VapC family toxin [Nitrospinota bacterium]